MANQKVVDLSTEKFIKEMSEINPKYDDSVIVRAYEIARSLHEGQFRKSGEPYIIHPVAVAKILANFGMDNETVIAGLLHDAVEDTNYTNEDLTRDFDEKIALLVDGVTKLGNISYDSTEAVQAENFRKMFLAMSKDIRVLIIKLADRLHNMRTLNYCRDEKRRNIAHETMNIYAPIAHRLGIRAIKEELQDLAAMDGSGELSFEVTVPVPGMHMVYNALAAAAWSASVFAVEALLALLTVISLFTYTRSYLPCLKMALEQK